MMGKTAKDRREKRNCGLIKQRGKCSHCNKEFNFEMVLNSHKMIEHGDDPPHICRVCNTAFFSTQVYSLHLLNHCLEKQEEDRAEFPQCCICGLEFQTTHSLRIHITNHAGIASHRPPSLRPHFMCQHCPAVFKTKSLRDEHLEDVHNQSMPFPCDLCTMAFRRVDQLEMHKQKHKELSGLSKEEQEKIFRQIPNGGKFLDAGAYSMSMQGKTFMNPRK